MKTIHEQGDTKTLFFKRGEEIMAGLKIYLEENDIKAAHITGLGACDELDIAYYNINTKEYERHTITEELEIVSLIGNVGIKEDGDTVIHMHGSFGRQDLSMLGGHIFSMRVSGAGEIHLRAFSGKVNRAYDEETGLTVMCSVPTDL